MKICVACFALLFPFCLGDQRPSEHHQQLSAYSLDGGYAGVASVAGVASRNGRVSTLGAVSFLPRTGSFSATEDPAHWFYPWTTQTSSAIPANYLGHNVVYGNIKPQFPVSDSFTPYPLNSQDIRHGIFNTLSSSVARLDAIRRPWLNGQFNENLRSPEVRSNYVRRNFMPYFFTRFYDPFTYSW